MSHPEASGRRKLPDVQRETLAVRVADCLRQDPRIRFAYLFGSAGRGQPFRDLDVAVSLHGHLGPAEATDVQRELAGKLERAVGLPVDVVILDRAPLGLRLEAVRGRLLFSRDEPLRLAFVASTCLQAADFAPLARQSLRDLLLWRRSSAKARRR